MAFRDLPPQKDPKGGSPRTPPGGIAVHEFDMPPPSVVHHNGSGIWKMATSFLSGIVLGLSAAWFTALQARGVTQKEMQEYDAVYSLYARDRQVLFERNNEQDRLIGGQASEIKKNGEAIRDLQYEMKNSSADRTSIHTKLDQVADMLQGPKK